MITVSVTAGQLAWLEAEAARREVSRAAVVRAAIQSARNLQEASDEH